MIKYFKNGVLEVETLDLPQDCGEIKVSIVLEEERNDANYYLEFACPRNVKYISQKLTRTADKEYEIILPRGISEYIGEVYVQMIIMSNEDAALISRSLIASNPLFVIKESILASNALDSSERRDFFEYAQNVVTSVSDKIDIIDKMIESVPAQITDIVEEQLEAVDEKLAEYQTVIDGKIENVANNLKNQLVGVEGSIGSNTIKIEENKSLIAEVQNDLKGDISSLSGSITQLSGNVTSVENGLSGKLSTSAVKNEYSSSTSEVYSTQYFNNNLKKFHKDSGEFTFTSSTTYSEVSTITTPAKGYLVVFFGSCNSGAAVSKVGILPVKNAGNTTGAVSNIGHTLSPASMGVVLCDYLDANTTVKFYCQCQTSGKRTTGYYRYILLEG